MTKDAHFSLSTVLRYRKSIEEEVAKETASLRKRLEEEELLLMNMERQKEEAIKHYREKRSQTVEEINLFHSFLSSIDIEIIRQKKKVSEMVKGYDRKREELISAAMDKKIMETLRDREWQEYQRLIFFAEQKDMDEVATNNYGRMY